MKDKKEMEEVVKLLGTLALGFIGALFGGEPAPKPKAEAPRDVANFASRSTAGKIYTVTAEKNEITCDCPGFHFRNDCRHVQDVMRALPFLHIKPRPEPEPEKAPVPAPPASLHARNAGWVSETFNGGRPVLRLASVKSAKSGNVYQIYAIDNGQVACTCNGYFYRGECRHSDNYLARQKGTFVA